ncbi:hypothetical protein AA0242T_0897 [Acetobacter aceti NRIC 0242]|uniref:Uncharacterized protein n=1 Tax=Acetobacter aceti NBRC 14818 TaxID=887700 RepID=A0AB33I8U1_ACEAC|nr:hypothetical protein [Acetobacter aceti]TCS34964.1 hypothetical protein EDC15_102175 [Acetobacter aceti NBRC 14818]BCK74456.1 hypothetical protein EMQ_0062 [Acetobacter aceti NBRC 14818]GAN55965.1 hypothetical protein Abac_002_114 [Acetobacter aceti NBRC 14818]GBO80195.1 hypothetical protein AA0242T_0897 [Acetobacter aceti NRIC 0242]
MTDTKYSLSIVHHGVEAIKAYRTISGIQQDNEMPEIFLGGQIAIGLNRELGLQVHIERPYLRIMKELGVTINDQIIEDMGGLRADIAIYREGKPLAIIEFKICDERDRRGGKLLADLEKMNQLSSQTKISTYLGVLLTDTANATCAERRKTLETVLGQKFEQASNLEPAGNNAEWHRQFIAGRFN